MESLPEVSAKPKKPRVKRPAGRVETKHGKKTLVLAASAVVIAMADFYMVVRYGLKLF